jgi:hypothetical protein
MAIGAAMIKRDRHRVLSRIFRMRGQNEETKKLEEELKAPSGLM